MWGQVLAIAPAMPDARIIPMRVGTRVKELNDKSQSWDHPHACGDKTENIIFIHPTAGSSPCVWGQVVLVISDLPFTRIIPMRVGTSRGGINMYYNQKDHPHACGDKVLFPPRLRQIQGSSPCVWGQVVLVISDLPFTRIIPMRVGTRKIKGRLLPPRWDHPHACGDKLLLFGSC